MNNTQSYTSALTLPLTITAHRIAHGFHQQHPDPQKAKQVYLNTLSVHTVNVYLNCLGIETDLNQSQSWDPILQQLINTADLSVTGYGRLECCPVLPDMQDCSIPMDVWGDRIGYIMVHLNADLTAATLLGFLPSVETITVPLSALRSLDEFPHFLQQQTQSAPSPTVLSQWFQQLVTAGWQTLETLQNLWDREPELVFNFRHLLTTPQSLDIAGGIKRGKLLFLDDSPSGQLIVLVGIRPTLNRAEFQITVELLPIPGQQYLPRSLHCMILNQAEQVVLQADGTNSEGLEFQFSGEAKEQFTVQFCWHDCCVQEVFVV